MKTTIEISEPLLKEAKALAAREGVSLRELVESGLRHILTERRRGAQFHLRDVRVDGNGIQAGFASAGWERIRDTVYEGRGG